MSWAEVKKINNNMSVSLDELILMNYPKMGYFYNSTTFKVPFDTGLTIRACSVGGESSITEAGGGGSGYVKDYRKYKKGDIINITIATDKTTITQSARNLNLVANAGGKPTINTSGDYVGGVGGTASGGNLANVTGGAGAGERTNAQDSVGCAGGGRDNTYIGTTYQNGGNGGFSGGNGGSIHSSGDTSKGGTGGFTGGAGGNNDYSSLKAGEGGSSTYGVGGNGGSNTYSKGTSSSGFRGGDGGNGGDGYIAGGNGGSSRRGNGGNGGNALGSTLAGKGGKGGISNGNDSGLDGRDGTGTEGNMLVQVMPRRINVGGGGGYKTPAGVAICIIEIGESIYPY